MRNLILLSCLWLLPVSVRAQPVHIEPIPEPAASTPTGECPALEQLGYRGKQVGEINLDIGLRDTRLPADCSLAVFQAEVQTSGLHDWTLTEFNWAASDLFCQPTYFDDPVLERYGQSAHPLVQPWLSGAHFFGQMPLVPYQLLVDHPCDRVYVLGYYRAGSPNPCVGRWFRRP